MARIDDLRPDQRAALQLLLQQGRSYDDIANLLKIEPNAVRERAHAALDALGPEDVPGLSLELQDEIADYLLGQQSASQRAGTRDFLQTSAGGRAWARAVSGELRPLAGDSLPEIPAEAAEVDEAFDALDARTARREKVERSTRVGGAILIGAAVLALAGLVLLAVNLLGDDEEGGNEKLKGVARVAEQDGARAVVLIAQGFPAARENPPRFYAVWLYKDQQNAERLGFPDPQPGKNGRLETGFAYPEDADKFDRLVITQESEEAPREPGRILLSGPLKGTPISGNEGDPSATTGEPPPAP